MARQPDVNFEQEFRQVRDLNEEQPQEDNFLRGAMQRADVEHSAAQKYKGTTDALLDARGKTHGKFVEHAAVTQTLKQVMRTMPNWDKLRPDQKEALEMNAHKVGRILAGDPDFVDHWDDIAGYAKLVADNLRGIVK